MDKIVSFTPIKLNNQRLPGKNLMELGGKPLCRWLFDTISKIEEIDKKYVYCSDEAIIPYMTAELQFLKRDALLDGFEIKAQDIIKAFVNDVKADIYMMIHVPQPFTRSETIRRAISKVASGEYDSAFSVTKLQDFLWMDGEPLNYKLEDIPRTQDLKPIYKETCAFYVFRREVFTELGRRIGNRPYLCETDLIEAVDIDTAEDFRMAEIIAQMLLHKQ